MSITDTLRRIERELPEAGRLITSAAGEELAESVMAHVHRATSTGRVAGQVIDVRAVPAGQAVSVEAVSGAGALAIVSNGTEPHRIGANGKRLRVGSGWATGPVNHPGTRGTNAFPNGIRAGMNEAHDAAERELRRVIHGG